MPRLLRALAFPVACALTGAAAGLLTVHLAAPPPATCTHGPVLELKQVATALAAAMPAPPLAPPPAFVPPPPPPGFRPLDAGAVRCRVENNYVVDRALVRELRDDPARFAHHARVMPSYRDGEFQGFKLYGLRRGSLPNLIGLRNGDTVTAINGASLVGYNSRGAALERYDQTDAIDLDVLRKGEHLRIHIDVE